MNAAPILKGKTTLVEDSARIATCWTGDLPPPAPSSAPGGISWPVEDDDPLSAARGIINGLILSLLIVGVPLLVWFAL